MPYRATDGFYPRTIDRRIVAALVLVMVGWATGFFAGRMSAWLLPVANPDMAALKAALAEVSSRAPAAPTRPDPQLTDDKQKTETVAAAAPLPVPDTPQLDRSSPNDERSRTPGNAELNAAAVKEVDASMREADNFGRGDALANPEWKRERLSGRQRDSDVVRESVYDEDGFADCERRYSSFRRSDGTYQPYGRNSRELCPLLR